jgi:hypothetical protein
MKTPREILLSRHQSADAKLDRMWRATLRRGLRDVTEATERVPPNGVVRMLWRELILPCRRIWAGLACVWVVIAVVNLAASDPSTQLASDATPRSGDELHALIEQRQMLAQLIGPLSEPAYTQRRTAPGPRSERPIEISAA